MLAGNEADSQQFPLLRMLARWSLNKPEAPTPPAALTRPADHDMLARWLAAEQTITFLHEPFASQCPIVGKIELRGIRDEQAVTV